MFKLKIGRKDGVVLLFVLATLLVVISLIIATLSMILSHSRLTVHQVERTKAYYAALAGINLANEQIRIGTWAPATTTSYCLCSASTCLATGAASAYCNGRAANIVDGDIPYNVRIDVYNTGSSPDGSGRKITSSVDYTSSYSY
jgi:Tfp pilus assembly protein PilX